MYTCYYLQAERAASATELTALKEAVTQAQAAVKERAAVAADATQRALHHVTSLTVERETIQKRLERYNISWIEMPRRIEAEP